MVEAHGYVYIVNDMQRPRANEKSGSHSSVSMKELPVAGGRVNAQAFSFNYILTALFVMWPTNLARWVTE